jgi:hypothetical protein
VLLAFVVRVALARPVPRHAGIFSIRATTPRRLWLLICILLLPSLAVQLLIATRNDSRVAALEQAAAYVDGHTTSGDAVLLWGATAGVNFATGRPSPTRYVYQYPFLIPGYQRPSMIAEFVDDLRRNKPALIIDAARETGSGGTPPLGSEERRAWQGANGPSPIVESMNPVFALVSEDYTLVGTTGPQGWPVYRYIGPP